MRNYDALVELLDERMRAPLAWGRHDCVCFARDAVKAQTGRDPMIGQHYRWRSERGAQRILAQLGGLKAAVDLVLPPVPPAHAQRGDVGMVEMPEGPILVVVEGETLVGVGKTRLIRLPRHLMTNAWSAA